MKEKNYKTKQPKVADYFQKALRDLLDFCDAHPHTVLYGAGVVGIFVAAVLEKYGKRIDAFIVSDGQSLPECAGGIPVFPLSQLPFDPAGCGVVITSSTQHHAVILNNAKAAGFTHFYPPGDHQGVIPEYGERIFPVYILDQLTSGGYPGFDFGAPLWDFKGCKLPNPYLENDWIWEPAVELQDFVLPALGYENILSGTDGPYEYGEVSLKPGDVVLDCGANMGYFSAVAAFRGCAVHAFEPSPSNMSLLQKTQGLYPDAITIVPCAVAEKCGAVSFVEQGVHVGNSIVWPGFDGYTVEVQTVALDSYVRKNKLNRVDFIKADIERAERQMLRGAQGILKEFAPKLAICTYHLPDDRQVLRDLILQANPDYQIHQGHSKLYAYVPDKELSVL